MNKIVVSKDQSDFFEIPDTDEAWAKAEAKGYKRYIDLTKDGKDIYTLPADDRVQKAFDKGYKTLDQFSFENSSKKEDKGQVDAGIRGTAQGATAGFGDELYGVVGAIANPTNSDKGIIDRYKDSRDYARGADKTAEEFNPSTYLTGQIAGGVASAAIVPGALGAKGMNTLKGNMALGGLQGYGGSEGENLGEDLVSTLGGVGMGAAGYGAGKLIEKGIPATYNLGKKGVEKTIEGAKTAKSIVSDPKAALEAISRGAKEGASESQKYVQGSVSGGIGSVLGGVKELLDTASVKKETGKLAEEARKVLKIRPLSELKGQIEVFGNGKTLETLADDEAITLALLVEGDNPVKQWAANSATQNSRTQSKDYLELLKMSSKDRGKAAGVDNYEAAQELVPTFENAKSLFTETRNNRFNDLQGIARESFSGKADEVFTGIRSAKEDAASLKSIPGRVRSLIDDVEGLITEGKGTRAQKLTLGKWDEVDAGERFNRLQKARMLIDDESKYAKKNDLSQAEQILSSLRSDIDGVLKGSSQKVEADALYKASKELENSFFRGAEFRNPDGSFEIDAPKIKKMLGDSDSAKRFRDNIELLEKFKDTPGLSREFRQQSEKLLGQLNSALKDSDVQKQLNALARTDGPSAAAIQRLGSVLKGNTAVQNAVNSPAGFLNTADNFNKQLIERFGKSVDELGPSEQKAAARMFIWLNKNKDNMNPEAVEKKWAEFFKR